MADIQCSPCKVQSESANLPTPSMGWYVGFDRAVAWNVIMEFGVLNVELLSWSLARCLGVGLNFIMEVGGSWVGVWFCVRCWVGAGSGVRGVPMWALWLDSLMYKKRSRAWSLGVWSLR